MIYSHVYPHFFRSDTLFFLVCAWFNSVSVDVDLFFSFRLFHCHLHMVFLDRVLLFKYVQCNDSNKQKIWNWFYLTIVNFIDDYRSCYTYFNQFNRKKNSIFATFNRTTTEQTIDSRSNNNKNSHMKSLRISMWRLHQIQTHSLCYYCSFSFVNQSVVKIIYDWIVYCFIAHMNPIQCYLFLPLLRIYHCRLYFFLIRFNASLHFSLCFGLWVFRSHKNVTQINFIYTEKNVFVASFLLYYSDLWAHGSDFIAKRKETNDDVFSGIAFQNERTCKNASEKKASLWKKNFICPDHYIYHPI